MLITAFAMLAGAGGAPRAAIAMGEGNREKAENIMGNCFAVLMILAVVLTAVFLKFCPSMIRYPACACAARQSLCTVPTQ